MTTIYAPAGATDRAAPLARIESRYRGAAALVQAIKTAAALAPESVPMLPRVFPPGAYDIPAREWVNMQNGVPGHWREWSGPVMPEPGADPDYMPRVAFHYADANGTRGALQLQNIRANLLAAADRVQKARAAFDGDKVRGGARRPATPAGSAAGGIRAAWQSGDYAAAIAAAGAHGGLFYGCPSKDQPPRVFMAPEYLTVGGIDFAIARDVLKGGVYISHAPSGLAISGAMQTRFGSRTPKSYSDARALIEEWMRDTESNEYAPVLIAAAKRAAPFDQETGAAYYLARDAAASELAPNDKNGAQACESAADAVTVQAPAADAVAPVSVPLAAAPDAPAEPAPVAEPAAGVDIGAAIGRARCEPPLQFLPLFVRLAIERADSDSDLRTSARVRELIDGYGRTYGQTAEPWEVESALHICRRRFWNFDAAANDGAPVDPGPTAPAGAPPATQSKRRTPGKAEKLREYRRAVHAWHDTGCAGAPPSDAGIPAADGASIRREVSADRQPVHMEATDFAAGLQSGAVTLASVGSENAYGRRVADGREVYAKDVAPDVVARFANPAAPLARAPRDGDCIRLHELPRDGSPVWHAANPVDCARDYYVRRYVFEAFTGAARWATCEHTGAFLYGIGTDGRELTAPPAGCESLPPATHSQSAPDAAPPATQSENGTRCAFKALRMGECFQFDADGAVWVRARGGFRPGRGGQLHACATHVQVIRYRPDHAITAPAERSPEFDHQAARAEVARRRDLQATIRATIEARDVALTAKGIAHYSGLATDAATLADLARDCEQLARTGQLIRFDYSAQGYPPAFALPLATKPAPSAPPLPAWPAMVASAHHAARGAAPHPPLRIPMGDPRLRIPARFAPVYLLQGAAQ